MEPCPAFDMWRDYLGLAAAVAALRRDAPADSPVAPAGGAPSASLAPGPAPEPPSPGSCPVPPCAFCKHNGEAKSVYGGHSLHDAAGRVLCPVLRSYVCPQCGATQERAHTRRFCPLTRRGYSSVYSRSAPRRRCHRARDATEE